MKKDKVEWGELPKFFWVSACCWRVLVKTKQKMKKERCLTELEPWLLVGNCQFLRQGACHGVSLVSGILAPSLCLHALHCSSGFWLFSGILCRKFKEVQLPRCFSFFFHLPESRGRARGDGLSWRSAHFKKKIKFTKNPRKKQTRVTNLTKVGWQNVGW